jgi:hypothetical protein
MTEMMVVVTRTTGASSNREVAMDKAVGREGIMTIMVVVTRTTEVSSNRVAAMESSRVQRQPHPQPRALRMAAGNRTSLWHCHHSPVLAASVTLYPMC